jgi:sporulation protein YlmC with PRC-barrel domain
MRVVYEESVRGRSVVDSTGRVIGAVDALVIDTEALRIDALRAKLDKEIADEIGAPHSTLRAARLDIPINFVQSVADAVILKGPVGTLRTLEHPTAEQPPAP